MKCTCKICGKKYEYCHACSLNKDIFRNNGYCGKDCYDISMLIQQYRSNALDPKDAMELLELYGIDKMMLVSGVAKYVDEIKNKAMPTEVKVSYPHKRNKSRYKVEESFPIEENTSSLTDENTELLYE